MPQGPEDIAREQIDRMLEQAGWAVQNVKSVNLYAKKGVAIREFELKYGYIYLLCNSIDLTQRSSKKFLPPLEEQTQLRTEIESRLSLISQLEAQVNANLMRAESLRRAVLKQAFSGCI